MSVNLRHLEAFVAVARLCSFTRAARMLNVSQPALTVQIRQLEENLRVRLLDRNTRSVRLTRVGAELAPVFERLLAEIDAVVASARELSSGRRGVVRVAALPSIAATLLPRVIAVFRRQYPSVSVVVRDAPEQQVLSMVRAEEADVGIASPDDAETDLDFTLLFRDHMSVVLPVGSPLLRKRTIDLKDLQGYPLILPSPESSVRRLVDQACGSLGLKLTPEYEVRLMSTVAGMVRAGLGTAILPSVALEMGELTGLRSRSLREPLLTREIGLLRKAGRSLPPPAESFLKSLSGGPWTRAL